MIPKSLKKHCFLKVFCVLASRGVHKRAQPSALQTCSFCKAKLANNHCFSMFLHFSMVSEEAFFSIKFACRTRFSDLNYIGPFSKNAIKTNVFLTISFAVNSQFIATSTFVVNLRKHEIVKIPLVFVPFWQLCFGKTSYCESKIHRNLRSKRKIPIFLQQRSNIEKPNR